MQTQTSFEEMIRRGRVRNRDRLTLDDCAILDRTARDIGAARIMEIGSAAGTSTMLLGAVARDNGGCLIAIEPHPEDAWFSNVQELGLGDTVRRITGFSPWVPELLDRAITLDYLFIDGEHKTRWAMVDYHCWFPKLRTGGRIAFHDIYGPCGLKVQRALNIILEDDGRRLREIARGVPARDCGVVVYEKVR